MFISKIEVTPALSVLQNLFGLVCFSVLVFSCILMIFIYNSNKFNRQIKPRGVASHPFQLYNNTYSQLIILDITWYARLDVHSIMIAILIGY